MSKSKLVSSVVVAVLLCGFVWALGANLAQAGRSDNGETGYENPAGNPDESSDVEVTGSEAPPLISQQSDNFLSNGEGQPDMLSQPSLGEEVELFENKNDSMAQYFLRSAGSNFQPRDSVATYSYGGGGCIHRDSNTGDSWFTIDVQVPDGAIIDFLRVYFYDNSAGFDINSELWAFDGAGGTTLIAEADSTGAPGYSTEGSGLFNHTVDNINESLVVVASIQGGVGSSLQLCGMRIRYQYNAFTANFLPAVLNETTP